MMSNIAPDPCERRAGRRGHHRCKALTTAPLQYPRGARHAVGTGWGKREACGSGQTACSAKVAQAAATAAAGATANTSGPRSSSLGLGHGHHPYWPPASSEDFSSCDLVLLGSVWVTPKGPARRSTAGTHSPEGDEPTGLDLSPRPPRRPWVTISQHEPIFLGRLHGTQWHRCHH